MNTKEAVVLLNMGGPSNLDEVDVFLNNMFNDKNILTIKSDLLRAFVAKMIVSKRSKEAKETYMQIGGKSPIVDNTFALLKELQALDDSRFYTYAMRYTPPFSHFVAKELQDKNINSVILFSMYPHYSSTTTLSSIQDFQKSLKALNYAPEIKIIDKYFDNHLYNLCILEQIKKALNDDSCNDFDLIFSAHSLPQRVIDKGDPYKNHIQNNVDILINMLEKEGLCFNKYHIAYQSKIGPIKWIGPSIETVIKSLSDKKLLIYPISFTIDNSESDFELSIFYRDFAKECGIKDFRVSKCLNNSSLFAKSIISMI